ncbi:primary-amine oxidase [Saccharopolyspora sp. WRP15-2]|uniref:Amine oxidase n=1 Tax=Saccharopolyspora oryzae TaxID=2997343 RepID=A0ABT4UZF8_9PSEU|nr:primary-amine oxidase [Saccharopolyspora oryzae]MDA3627101.1 primary-amine oxidase [Saccharopolyspora oryzae]
MSTMELPVLPADDSDGTTHPLAALTPAEIDATREILAEAGLVTAATRFSYVMLREPDKQDVLEWDGSTPLPREVSLLVTELEPLGLSSVVVDLTAGEVVSRTVLDPAEVGFGPCLDEDFELVDQIVKSDEGWLAAVAKRGITDVTKVRPVPLTAGVFGYPDEVGRRMYRVLSFYQPHPGEPPWAHPVGGVIAHVDVSGRRVLRVVETHVEHVPEESGDYLHEAVRGPQRTDLKPISITQPEGVSFEYRDGVLSWQNWQLRVGFNGREGLTLHQVSYADGGVQRPVLYRASVAEMVVNYGDPGPTHGWQNYFDLGEYQFGRLANSLELGCDCLGEITYVDAVVSDDHLRPHVIRNAICIHEEDFGVLWKHNDIFTGTSQTRRQRRLVVSFFGTVGNYDYGFYWYFYLDGTIELEAKATGIPFPSGYDGQDPHFAELAPGLGAPVHQHLFSARLDMTVDGVRNHVDELEVAPVPPGEGNPWGNAIGRKSTRLRTEHEAQRVAANHLNRVWAIASSERTNRFGKPTSYVLHPEGQPALLADEHSSVARRATFARKHLWVTRYDRDQLWPSGYTVNQNPGGDGLPAYAAEDRPIDGEDVVLWHTFGLTHYVRTEDWPIMPVDYTGFKLKPDGFFDRNPTLDVPDLSTAHGCCGGGECGCHD